MRNKKSIFKSIFLCLCAFCFLGGGIALWQQPENLHEQVYAEDTGSLEIDNGNLPTYFSAEEFLLDGGASKPNENSLTSSDTFLYFSEGSTSNYLKLSLKQNYELTENKDSSIAAYSQVYYPDPSDLSTFYFYSVNSVSLYINGEKQSINMGDYVTGRELNLFFANKSEVQLDGFEMYFTNGNPTITDGDATVPSARQFSITDDNGEIVEGVYQISLTFGLFLCTDGGVSGTEEKFDDQNVTLDYSFYVLGRDNFIANNNPNVEIENFDKTVAITELTNKNYAYYLYSNYSSNPEGSADEANAYKIPYIEYDYTRFEASISKEISEKTSNVSLMLDKDAYADNLANAESNLAPIVQSGDDIIDIVIDKDNTKVKVFFYDVGNYTLTLNAIKLVDFKVDENTTELRKYNLSGVSSATKKINVYMYGYQANYTNADLPTDANNIRPLTELKDRDLPETFADQTKSEKFIDSADITSGFLNSKDTFAQGTAGNKTFLISNVLDYIDTNNIQPVKTDQTPIAFTSNATLSQGVVKSYIYSTVKANSSYSEYASGELQDEQLYQTTFTGLTDNAIGKYIYVLAYTFNNFYASETTLDTSTIFYQVFFFEIEKEIPTISITSTKVANDGTSSNIDVLNEMYVNQDVYIEDTTDNAESKYKKDVTIQIYAKNFDKETYVDGYGGENGIAYKDLLNGEDAAVTLTKNGHYTIRLYYTSEMTGKNISLDSTTGFFREQSFTIDKTPIEDIAARNFVEITNSTNYRYYSYLTDFTTNQSIALSWKEKDSDAATYAYYRYFPIVDTQYYSKTASRASSTIERMLKAYGADKHYMPVNHVLDMSTTNNQWLEYEGNTWGKEEIASDYVFSDEGLYLVDVYDEAGNHTVEVFMIDKTTPMFSINTDGTYELVSSSVFITKPCSLYWGNYKALFIANFETLTFTSRYTADNIDEEENFEALKNNPGGQKGGVYTTHDGSTCSDIFKVLYNKLYSKDYLEYIVNNSLTLTTSDGLSSSYFGSSYTSYYLTIPINNRTFYVGLGYSSYISKEGTDNWFQDLTTNEEMTYRVLIRDLSNTKYDQTILDKNGNLDKENVLQYTGYYSAYQTIIVSFDDSEFFIEYQNGQETSILSSNNVIEDVVTISDKEHRTKTTYLSPTKMQKAFSLSFLPTTNDNGKQIQVDKVTIDYYPYVESHVTYNGITYSYLELSQNPTTMTVYDFSENGAMTTKKTDEIRLDSKNITAAGKYVITRTYKIDGNYSYNENDFYQRTYVFIVDRNDVITSAELTEENPHLESLVGGDVFVSMYDTKTDATLVVTYPNSSAGSTDGTTLYNNGSTNPPRTVFTTNKMPVRLYIPKYKYTTYTTMTVDEETGRYGFNVNYNFADITNGELAANAAAQSDYMNFFKVQELQIAEYVLSANIYKDKIDPRNLYATASPMVDKVDGSGNSYIEYDDRKTTNGFLNLYDTNGNSLDTLTEAGIYYVQLFQGRYGTEVSENSYNQSIIFAFEIQKTNPNFEAQSTTGSALNYERGSGKVSQIYHTNQANINLLWDAGSKYMAEIDLTKILFETSNGRKVYAVTFDDKDNDGIKDDDEEYGWENIFVDGYEPSTDSLNKQYITQISLEKLGVYFNGGYVDITMQYQNHNTTYYSTVTKRIYVDLSAPSTNVQNLVTMSTQNGLIAALQNSALRTYYTAKMDQTQNLSETSYNTSNSTGTFAYYSYSVSETFLQTLKNSISSAEAYQIYAKKFDDSLGNSTKYVSGEQQETSPADFLPSNNFTLLAGADGEIDLGFTFDKNSYYEIVEIDRAGNMAIYTIYVTNYNSIVNAENGENNIISFTRPDEENGGTKSDFYTIDDYIETKSYPSSTHNIYSPTGFKLKSINYFGDAWAQIKLEALDANGFKTTYRLMLTPWDKDYAYAYSGLQYTKILLSDLVDGSVNSRFKSALNIYNRQSGATDSFYINVRNATLEATLTNNQDEEYIRFAMPTDASIQNTIYGSTYLTALKITTKNNALLYEDENKTGFASKWASNENIQVLYDSNSGTITFKLSENVEFSKDTKIIYEYTDNYGNVDKQIHIYRETVIPKVVDAEYLYAYYDNSNGRLYYITENNLKYSYNPAKYSVKIFEVISGNISEKEVVESDDVEEGATNISSKAYLSISEPNGYTTLTITHCEEDENGELLKNYNNTFAIQVYDADDETKLIQTIYFTLYNGLPTANTENQTNSVGSFRINDANNNNITSSIIGQGSSEENGYFSEIRITYNLDTDAFIPVKYSISTDNINWRELSNGEKLECQTDNIQKYYLKVWYDEEYLKNEVGSSQYVFGLVPPEQIYEFNLSALTQTYWVEQTINGETFIVEKSNKIYRTSDGTQYSNHYIVTVDYADRNSDPIKTNKELKIKATRSQSFSDGAGVYSELWVVSNKEYLQNNSNSNIPAFSTNVVISYIPITDNFVEEFYVSNADGILNENKNLVNYTSETVVVNENSTVDQIELRWTKYYGIPQNEINIKIVKDGIELHPNVYTKTDGSKQYNYVRLNHSGKYRITLYDSSIPGNIQKFNIGNAGQTETFTLVFLKDVPFTVTYTNIVTNESETSLPINEAVYNGSISLNIDKASRSEFYSIDGYPVISVKRNGVIYTDYFQDDTTYIFNETGYYEVTFSATSNLPDVGKIRRQTWRFTILNANEHRYTYIYNRYSNYYIEKVEKNGIDVTDTLIKTLDVATYTINNKPYLAELPLSYLDEKTGGGTYLITVNSNDKLLSSSSAITRFTFKVIINVGEAPIRVSLNEGESTTGSISVSYNLANVYREMGECVFRIIRYEGENSSTYFARSVTSENSGEETITIDQTGTYYVQILSPSGNLLYSYKVIRNEPLNAAAIIAIVISAVLLVAIIFIIVKLRKRISVK